MSFKYIQFHEIYLFIVKSCILSEDSIIKSEVDGL